MMTANAQAFALSLCLVGLMGWMTLIIGFGLIGVMRKIIGWILSRVG